MIQQRQLDFKIGIHQGNLGFGEAYQLVQENALGKKLG